jgi:hypothetical protein
LKSTPPRCFGLALGFFDASAAPPLGRPMTRGRFTRSVGLLGAGGGWERRRRRRRWQRELLLFFEGRRRVVHSTRFLWARLVARSWMDLARIGPTNFGLFGCLHATAVHMGAFGSWMDLVS